MILEEASRNNAPEIQALADKAFNKKVPLWVKILLVVVLALIIMLSFFLGRYSLTPAELFNGVVFHFQCMANPELAANMTLQQEQIEKVIFSIRLPRILLVVLVGASYQGMFKNPLVSPDILGASAGASLGACVAMLFNQPNAVIQLAAFSGGLLAVGMAVWLTKMVKYDALLGLVLGGMLVSTLFQSGTSLVKFVADAQDQLPTITFWLMGSFNRASNSYLLAAFFPILVGFIILLLQSWKLNVLSFGDDEARAMGINTKRVRLIVILASTLLSSASVAVAGMVGWVGLVVPHLARAIVGPNYKVLLPTSMFIGATYLLIIDDIARNIAAIEIPLGILTSLLGVPFFIFIFRRNMKGWR